MTSFEGSYLGDSGRITRDTVMECGVCWWVYDPAKGDEIWHIAPGTPFAELPAHWRCPNCDAAPGQFMALRQAGDSDAGVAGRPHRTDDAGALAARSAALTAAYHRAATAMKTLPVFNRKLSVEIVGMQRCEEGLVAVAVTPWCMNLVLLPADDRQRREGTSREVAFPSGRYPFIAGHLEGVGAIETCSLFSPMDAFDSQEAASSVASEAITALFRAESGPEPGRLSRRQFLRPGATA